ncbi:MAG: long-chain fatty acid--CoA ligase [Pedosphaera sp.]|nr:long-chain fatty acid--CoA ligase [Pedosphaera sp.]
MLYDRWRQIAQANHAEMALRETAGGRSWTFAQLADAAESICLPPGPFIFPQGISADFILTVLAGWREGRVVCPLDAGQEPLAAFSPPSGCSHLKMTSASNGFARPVAFTAGQLAADPANIVASMGLRPDWPNLGVISLAHSYGFSNLVLPLLLHGIPLVLVMSHLPEALRAAAEGLPAVTLAAVPVLWRVWDEADAIPGSVRLAISAGAPLPLPLELQIYERCGLKVHNFYGASECGGIAYDRTTVPRTDASCVGQAIDNVQLSIGAGGCLVVGGGAVGQAYVPDEDAVLRDRCFRTTDLVEIRDGIVHLRGRVGDLINIAGRKLPPETVERALLTHPDVGECLVFGAPSNDSTRNDVGVAIIVPRRAIDGEALRQHLSHALPAWQIPREWRFVKSLPTNARGKLSRAEWRQRFCAGDA